MHDEDIAVNRSVTALEMSAEQSIELNGKTYPMLADGEYDVIILGTGLKECMLAGLLSKKGMKVFMYFELYV